MGYVQFFERRSDWWSSDSWRRRNRDLDTIIAVAPLWFTFLRVVISILMRNIERKSRLSHCCLWWQLNNVLRFEVNRHRSSCIYVPVLCRS